MCADRPKLDAIAGVLRDSLPMPKAISHDWNAIEQLAIAGVPYPIICETHGVNGNTLRARVKRGQWPVPRQIEKAAMMARAATGGNATAVQRGGDALLSGASACASAAQVLAQRGELGSLRASELILGLLERATVERLKPLATITDLSTALSAVRKAAGMDRGDGANFAVAVSMFTDARHVGGELVPWDAEA